MPAPKKPIEDRAVTMRNLQSPLWQTFRSGMTAAELAFATNSRISRLSASQFFERALRCGVVIRKKDKGQWRFYRTDEAPDRIEIKQIEMPPLKPRRSQIIPVRDGGRIAPVSWQGRSYVPVGASEASA